ncbi:MAG: hypothetical protein H6Q00_2136 [Holophagaceae bacterium]|nr:hypothetical protein [Holophagaceae bacterium]
MSRGWHLGGVWYEHRLTLPGSQAGLSWHLVQQGSDGARALLQYWEPAPQEREQDQIKHEHLQQIQAASPLDPLRIHFGVEEARVWLLQELEGESLASLWPDLASTQRQSLLATLETRLKGSPCGRFLHPETINFGSGRLIVPRVLGSTPLSLADLKTTLELLPSHESGKQGCPWEAPPDLTLGSLLPIRGRLQELTYLKSLMFGIRAGSNWERVVVIQGEEGLGKELLAAYAAAAAETEGIRVNRLDLMGEESAGHFLGRLLQDLIQGTEAEFYAQHPEVARSLAARVESFAFLRGVRKHAEGLAQVEPAELASALTLLQFAQDRHPRLILLQAVDCADSATLGLLKDLIRGSRLPWLLVANNGGPTRTARPLLGPLSQDPDVAILNLKRLEDLDLREVMEDLLKPHDLPEDLAMEICRASLGNAGLLRNILERAQLEGALAWEQGRWRPVIGKPISLVAHPGMLSEILSGRFRRLPPAAALIARLVALGDDSVSLSALGRAVGLAGEPLEEAIQALQNGKFVQVLDGRAAPTSPQVRDLALEGTAPAEIKRLARTLLKAIQDESRELVLSVRLQSYASDVPTALARVMDAIEQPPPAPNVAESIVRQTLALGPSPAQRARLWEFLADSWTRSTIRGRVHPDQLRGRSPYEWALDSLDQALLEEGEEHGALTQRARALRKKAFLELRLRRIEQAEHTARRAQSLLMDHLFHEEQTRLRLALGRGYFFRGHVSQAARHFEEGKRLVECVEQRESHAERAGLLQDLGQIQMERCQFHGALGSLLGAQRILEHGQDHRRLVGVLLALGSTHFAMGQPQPAHRCTREAMAAAQAQDDLELIADCHLAMGLMASVEQDLTQALSSLEEAMEGYGRLSDRNRANRAALWKARTLACLGDPLEAEHILLELTRPGDPLSAQEEGERLALQAEILAFRGAWGDAARVYLEAAECHRGFGLSWRESLTRLRRIQALAQDMDPDTKSQWSSLEALKEAVTSSGSRWLELEWHHAHALLLSGASDALASEALRAWGEVLTTARELGRTALVLEASTQGACLLLKRGEELGARAKIQEACTSFQELWGRVPAAFGPRFLGRSDLHHFRLAVESVGLDAPHHLPPPVGLPTWDPA